MFCQPLKPTEDRAFKILYFLSKTFMSIRIFTINLSFQCRNSIKNSEGQE